MKLTKRAENMAIIERRAMTLIELIVCTVIIGILSSTAVPISRNYVRRQKENLLRERLRDMRGAIDRYHDRVLIGDKNTAYSQCFPSSLQELVDKRFLRRIPVDPMTEKADWTVRSTTDDPNATISDGVNVFDVQSSSDKTDAKGVPYSSW